MNAHLSPIRPRPIAPPTPAGVRELMAIREIAQVFLTVEKPEEVFRFALDRVSPLVGAALSCVYLCEEEGDLMRLAAAHNWPQRYAAFLDRMRVRVGSGPSGRAVAERRAIKVLDVFADRALADWRDVAAELGFRSLVALPLQTGNTVHGAIAFYFASADAGGSTPEMDHLLRTVADQMAATAEKARLIADLRRTNAALASSNVELERQYVALLDARRVKDEFLANISHELRTPLTAVMGYVSLMQEGIAGPMTDDQQETLGEVKGASEQLLALISDLLELTSLKRGVLEVTPEEVGPNGLLRTAATAAGGRRAGVMLELIESPDEPQMWTDRAKVVRILAILLGNAAKFTPRGMIRASVRVAAGRVSYMVEDTGIGIAEEAQQLIFEEFRQVDGTATRPYGGAGLGLSLARRLARLLGGDISVASTPGVGSTFRLDLPLTYDGSDGAADAMVPPGQG